MPDLATRPHHLACLPCLALAFGLAACTGTGGGGEGDETGETGNTGGEALACIEPGTELLPEAEAVELSADLSSIMCSSGWATDAPARDADWSVSIGLASDEQLFTPISLDSHPEGGVVVLALNSLARYDADGEELWANEMGMNTQEEYAFVVEEAGTIVRSIYNWNEDFVAIDRFDADGNLVEPIEVAWNSLYPSVWGLASSGSDLIIGAFDEDDGGVYENTLIRLDSSGNQLLRKSTNMVNGQLLAVNGSGTVMFGSQPGFLLSLDNGAVLGTLTPSAGFTGEVVGGSEDFFMVGGNAGDLSVGRYSGVGTERWLQAYDRANINDQGVAIDLAADGTIVVAGTTQSFGFAASWFNSQPLVIAVDAGGGALWTDRVAVYGTAVDLAISDGVYVVGMATAQSEPGQEASLLYWLRKYSL